MRSFCQSVLVHKPKVCETLSPAHLSVVLKDCIILFVYLACGEVTKSISSHAVRYHIEDISPVPQGTDIIN